MDDEQLWKRRFLIFSAARLTGLLVFLLGLAIAWSDLARVGGWPALGAFIAALGAIDAIFSPRLLKKIWEKEDVAAGRRNAGPNRR